MPVTEERMLVRSDKANLVAVKVVPGGAEPDGGWPVVILVHGAIDYKEHFLPLARSLARIGIASVVPDMRGHGESGGPRYHVRMHDWLEDLDRLLGAMRGDARLNESRLGGFGFSSGGTAVLEAAASGYPFRALVTLDATVRSILSWYEKPAFTVGAWLGRLKERLTGKPLYVPLDWALDSVPAAVDVSVQRQIMQDPYVRAGYRRFPLPGALEAFEVDTLSRVHRITCPVLILHGEEDRLDPPETARRLSEALTCEHQVCLLPGSGHVGHLDGAREVVQAQTCDWFQNRL